MRRPARCRPAAGSAGHAVGGPETHTHRLGSHRGQSPVADHPAPRAGRGGRQLGTGSGSPRTTKERHVRRHYRFGAHQWHRPHTHLRSRQAGPAGRRSRRRPDRRHRPAGHGHRLPVGPGGGRLLPADRRHRGADLRRRQDPRLVLPPGGQVLGPGHPHLPPDRPAAAPVVPEGLPQRGPRRRAPSSAPTRSIRTTSWPSTPPRPP